jgi:hypothetical protein
MELLNIKITAHAILRYCQRVSSFKNIELLEEEKKKDFFYSVEEEIKKELYCSDTKWIPMKELPTELLLHLSLRALPGGWIAFNSETGVLFKIHFDRRNKVYIVVSVDKVDGALRDALSELISERGKQLIFDL